MNNTPRPRRRIPRNVIDDHHRRLRRRPEQMDQPVSQQPRRPKHNPSTERDLQPISLLNPRPTRISRMPRREPRPGHTRQHPQRRRRTRHRPHLTRRRQRRADHRVRGQRPPPNTTRTHQEHVVANQRNPRQPIRDVGGRRERQTVGRRAEHVTRVQRDHPRITRRDHTNNRRIRTRGPNRHRTKPIRPIKRPRLEPRSPPRRVRHRRRHQRPVITNPDTTRRRQHHPLPHHTIRRTPHRRPTISHHRTPHTIRRHHHITRHIRRPVRGWVH